jgi:hypothetical protein
MGFVWVRSEVISLDRPSWIQVVSSVQWSGESWLVSDLKDRRGEAADSGKGTFREPRGRGMSAVGSRYQATTSEDKADLEDLVRAAVMCCVCELAIAL